MTPKNRIFVHEYLIDLNATQAAHRAGYSDSYARRACYVLLRKPEIAKAVADGMAARTRRLEIDGDRVMREYAKIAFANIGNLAVWGKDGVALRDHKEISEDDAAAIVEVSIDGKHRGRIKLHDKRAALDALGRHVGMFKPRSAPFAGDYSNAQQRRARAILHQRVIEVLAEDADKAAAEKNAVAITDTKKGK